MQGTLEHWDQVAFKDAESGWEALDENGWFAMMAWAAGPDNVRKTVQSDEGRIIRRTVIADGVESTRLEPFTPEDRAIVEDAINSDLESAGIPPRPSGFVWHLRIPGDWSGDSSVIDTLGARILKEQRDQQTMAALRSHIERIVAGYYTENGC
ncbi:hypothetical protein JOF48_001375 [Arthrobacter stackebrandtii]|uniref:Uncharacterized protein n=1 Tax=Arthrobacter stackebrandtii TaxID=272161 RepID=A0ABS4YUV4_9MICC|nr:DUF5956 family protein [Arthrobacter stackebrandtii]MBP2412576.1 hypothetical protein [Arthrobacter stackebrandtii]PYH02317.1 hypothetical protein CVV67_02520 [Arthrobacter stackebrandtii]